MTEPNILQILTKAALNLSEVKSISKSIADTIYGTANTRTIYESKERLNALVLLQKCCLNRTNHLSVNQANYSCFLTAIEDTLVGVDEDDYDELPPVDVTKSVMQYYEQLARLDARRRARLSIITEYNRKNCTIPDFKYRASYGMYNNCLDSLNIIHDQSVAIDDVFPKMPTTSTVKIKADLAYALMNFKDASACGLLCKILQRWSLERLDGDQTKFIDHLWDNIETLNDDLLTILSENFMFTYEKRIIKACTDLLRNDESGFTPSAIKMLAACSNNKKLRCTVKNLLYALYACSGFNAKLLKLIEM